jgi:polysaccharide pyruvyl transferase WcaK-like protein
MKIGILTQPLQTNYGGILQNYALQAILSRMGHEVKTIDRQPKQSFFKIKRLLSFFKRILLRYLLKKKIPLRVWLTKNEKKIIKQHTDRFIKNYIKTTDTIYTKSNFSSLKKYDFNAYIVGSDQVWRPCYSPSITNYFLDFIENSNTAKKIAYAASFGVDYWEFTNKQTKQCSFLAKNFNAISVREDTGVKLCNNFLGVNSIQVLDPTMLLKPDDYIHLIDTEIESKNTNGDTYAHGYLMTYILDHSDDKQKVAEYVSKELSIPIFSAFPPKSFSGDTSRDLNHFIYPPITSWLRGFLDSKFVITDSFHGCVFSILFNRPFIAIGNMERGMGRFTSLLKMFSLENRMVTNSNTNINDLILEEIEWATVNSILDNNRQFSINFLNQSLL